MTLREALKVAPVALALAGRGAGIPTLDAHHRLQRLDDLMEEADCKE